ncbi:MAG: thymidine kinase [Candidatus Ornithospirochaeta sp.]|nr:thymidine kinase [Candidatus Ornithospirochaeta sp.]
MPHIDNQSPGADFLKSLGFPTLDVHETFTHFDFTKPGRRVLLIGPMGSGKTEFAARVWRDASIAQRKSDKVARLTSTGSLDRRKVFFIRSDIDGARFTDYPDDALAYRSGYIRCGENIARIRDSFGFEQVLKDNPDVGTYIIDEASFFDERLAYVARNYSIEKGCMFVFPTLILNFRKEFFNSTARLMLDIATDVIPLTAYCEHPDCMADAFYTYRYYRIGEKECPALYFDPLIVVGGDREKDSALEPNYASRCDMHHYLPGKEYTFFTLKPLAEEASRGNTAPLYAELEAMKCNMEMSLLYRNLEKSYSDSPDGEKYMNSLETGLIAEKALSYLFCEQNLINDILLQRIVSDLRLDTAYLEKVLSDNRHPVSLDQPFLF